MNQTDNTLGLVHTSVYELFAKGIVTGISEKEANIDIAQTCLRYLTMKPLAAGPCRSSIELSERFQTLPFLDYSAKHWGQHIIVSGEGSSEEQLEPLIMKLLENEHLRGSAFQALQYRQEYTDNILGEEIFRFMPTHQGALHVAAYWNLFYICKRLLAEKDGGVDVSARDSHNWTALHWACSKNQFAIAELLLSSGANVNAEDIQRWTPLIWAAFAGNLALPRLLLSNGADHHVRSTLGWTALHWAIVGGHIKIVRELLEHHSRSESAEPALHKMSIGQIESYAETTFPIEVATDTQDGDIFDLVVQHLQIEQESVENAMFNPIWPRGHFDAPVSLNPWRNIDKGERANGREWTRVPRFKGYTNSDNLQLVRSDPIKWKSSLLLWAICDDQFPAFQMLVKIGADVSFRNALHVAAFRKDPRYAQYLLEHGADPNGVGAYSRTALHEAVMHGFVDTAAALIDGGADVNLPIQTTSKFSSQDYMEARIMRMDEVIRQDCSTPLMHACYLFLRIPGSGVRRSEVTMDLVQLLLSKGANPHAADASGRTILHYVAKWPYLPLIKLLLEAGSLVDVADHNGRMPIHWLAMCEDKTLDINELKEITNTILAGRQTGPPRNLLDERICPPPSDADDGHTEDSYTKTEESYHGLTPIGLALKEKRWDMVRVFSELGAAMPITGLDLNSILDNAIKDLEVGVVDFLIANGARPCEAAIVDLASSFVTRQNNLFPRRYTGRVNLERIPTSIITAGANVNFCVPDKEDTALGIIATKLPKSRHLFHALLRLGADIYSPSSHGFDPILIAAVFGESEDLRQPLEHAVVHPHSRQNHWSRFLVNGSSSKGSSNDPYARLCVCLQKAGAINERNQQGRTLLHLAAEQGNVPLITRLLSCDAKIDITDDKDWLPMHCAGFAGHEAAFDILFTRTMNDISLQQTSSRAGKCEYSLSEILNKENEDPKTMASVAIKSGSLPMVRHLLQHDVDGDIYFRYLPRPMHPLYYAASKGDTELVSVLLSLGANIEAADKFGWRPLHAACYFGHIDTVEMLIEAGADVHAATRFWNNNDVKPTGIYEWRPWTGQPLHLAVMRGNPDIVKILLDKKVDIHATTGIGGTSFNHGPTALHLALDTDLFYRRSGESLDENRLRIAQWLVDRGAMVQGVIGRRFSLEDMLKFRKFPELWEALVSGDE